MSRDEPRRRDQYVVGAYGDLAADYKWLMEDEERLRRLATALQLGEQVSIREILEEINDTLDDLADLADVLRYIGVDGDMQRAVKAVQEFLLYAASAVRYGVSPSLLERMRRALREASGALGRSIGFVVPHVDKPSPAGVINDAANAVHVLAEEVAKRYLGQQTGDKIYVSEAPAPPIRDVVEAWKKMVEEMNRQGLYVEEDYEPLAAFVRGLEADFRVGSSPGHAARVRYVPAGRMLVVEYWDQERDFPVVETLRHALTIGGCATRVEGSEGSVVLRAWCPLGSAGVVGRALAAATSMDFRLLGSGGAVPETSMEEEVARILGRRKAAQLAVGGQPVYLS